MSVTPNGLHAKQENHIQGVLQQVLTLRVNRERFVALAPSKEKLTLAIDLLRSRVPPEANAAALRKLECDLYDLENGDTGAQSPLSVPEVERDGLVQEQKKHAVEHLLIEEQVACRRAVREYYKTLPPGEDCLLLKQGLMTPPGDIEWIVNP